MLYYILFTYMFLLGVGLESTDAPFWNLLLAPIVFPVLLGKWFAKTFMKL